MKRRLSKGAARPRRRRRGGLWRWLGLGALAALFAFIWRQEQRRHQGRLLAAGSSAEPPPAGPSAAMPSQEGPAAEGSPDLGELPSDAVQAWIPGPGGSLRLAERHPAGQQAVIFVHALGGRLEQWAAQMASLGPMYRSIAFDLPGHGESDAMLADDYSMPTLASAIGAVADGLRLRRFVLVGHSLGASAAIEYAGQHPDRVAGLLLLDPNGDQTRIAGRELEELLASVRQDPQEEMRWHYQQILVPGATEVAERVLQDLAATPPEVIVGSLQASLGYSPLPALKRYLGPVGSVICDLNDLPYSLHNLLPELPVSRLYGAGHWLMLDRPAEVNELLQAFLMQVNDRSQTSTVH